jgi:hypothetical protein
LYVEEFNQQHRKDEYWDGEYFDNLNNSIRNIIAIASDGLQEIRKALYEIVNP